MAVRAEFVRQVVCREAPGEDEVGVRCRRHRGTISAVRRPTRRAPTRRNWCCTCRRRRTAGTLNAAGGVLVHQYGEAVRVVICACRAGTWGFVWHRTFSLSRAQSRTCVRLCRGGKTKNEIQRFTPAANRRDRGGFRSGVGIPPTGRAVRPQNLCMARTRNEMFFDVCSTKGGSIPIWVVMAVHASSPSVEEK